MAKKYFQNVVHQLKETVGRTFGIIGETGEIVVCSDPSLSESFDSDVFDDVLLKNDKYMSNGYTYCPINAQSRVEYVLFVLGEDDEASRLATILTVTFSNIKALYDEKYDKSAFIKNVITDNVMSGDIYLKAKEFRLESDAERVTMLIKITEGTDALPIELIQKIFPDKENEYIINAGDNSVVLVKELEQGYDQEQIEALAKSVSDTITSELFINVVIGVGNVAQGIRELSRSYKEAQIALDVGKIFNSTNNIIFFNKLGIGRLIYQLPTTLCEIFLNEVFKKGAYESLDREALVTIQSFFENNLNVSETSRKLFVHRNTLVYRLEKIRKQTGLDLREFEHAITFKVALMVKQYLTSKPYKY